jgi:hypothetical protein
MARRKNEIAFPERDISRALLMYRAFRIGLSVSDVAQLAGTTTIVVEETIRDVLRKLQLYGANVKRWPK